MECGIGLCFMFGVHAYVGVMLYVLSLLGSVRMDILVDYVFVGEDEVFMVDEFIGEIGGEVYIYTMGIPAPCLGGPSTVPLPLVSGQSGISDIPHRAEQGEQDKDNTHPW